LLTPEAEALSNKKEVELPPRRHAFHHCSLNNGRTYFNNNDIYERKWFSEDLENYFSRMRISPSTSTSKDTDSRTCRGNYERASPVTNPSPIETDESLSGESMGTSSGNTLSSINGSVGNGIPERNKVVLEKIRMGLDMRTTIMIKNVPNKYTQVRILETKN
jgi:hypothetical protein